MRLMRWRSSTHEIQLISDVGRERLARLHHRHQAEVSLDRGQIQAALASMLQPVIHAAVAELVAACTPEQSDAVLAYLSEILDQRTATAAKSVVRPAIFGNGANGPLEPDARTLRQSFAKLAALEALRMLLETGNVSPWKNAKSISFANLASLDIGLEANVRCPACGEDGSYRLKTLDVAKPALLFRGMFSCQRCRHSLDTTDARVSSKSCDCHFCAALNSRLASDLRQLVADESPRAMSTYEREFEHLKMHQEPTPDQDRMRRDWVLHKNDPNKALRALIELKPKDGEDFLNCLNMYLSKHNGKKNEILGLAERYRLIYRVTEEWLPECHSFQQLMTAAPWPIWSSETQCWLHDEQATEALDKAAVWLSSAALDTPGVRHLEVSEQAITLVVDGASVQLYAEGSGWMCEALHRSTRGRLVLNPYFLQGESSLPPEATSTRLFRSNTECNAFHRIRAELPSSIVVPNYPMRSLVDVQALKPHFSAEDFMYVQNCELDLVVCNDAGYVAYVEEVQRGDHHNTREWSRKDALKRQALKLAGIPFRESF